MKRIQSCFFKEKWLDGVICDELKKVYYKLLQNNYGTQNKEISART